MPTRNQVSSIETGITGWISIHIQNQDELPADPRTPNSNARLAQPTANESPVLFTQAPQARISLPERFPRLTFLTIALALLASALTAEIDYLRGAGYYWPGR